jgi:hypothetical protein
MPREYAKNWFSMWADEDFCNQPVFDKLFYNMLCGQRGVNNAGVLAINYTRWRKAMRDGDRVPTERDLKTALRRMERRRYVFVDEDAGEVLIRAHVRRDELEKQPNILLSALRLMKAFDSAKFAAVMLSELARIEVPTINSEKPSGRKLEADLKVADAAARTHLLTLSEGLGEPFPEPFSEDFPEPPHPRTPREPFSEGLSEPPVVVEVEVVNSPSTDQEIKTPPYPPEPVSTAVVRLPSRTNNGADTVRARIAKLPARSVAAYQIAESFSASLAVPIEPTLLAGIGTQIDKCLSGGIPPHAIADGLRAWTASDSWSPTQIPNFVHKAANRNTIGKPTAKALGYDAAVAELLAELEVS